jgi:hypothetical protein
LFCIILVLDRAFIFQRSSIFLSSFIFQFWRWNQGLVPARQALYYWATS